MATTFNGVTRRIILDTPTAGVLNVLVGRDLYSEWKQWVKVGDNAKYPPAFRTVGGDPLTPGVEAGAYFFMQNQAGSDWRIISSDADQTINYNGNLVGEDGTLPLIVVTPGRSVLHLGLQPVTQRVDEILTQTQKAAYNGAVAIDPLSTNSGTAFPIGTASTPVNNLPDAVAIATELGVQTFRFRGAITLNQNYPNWTFIGIGSEKNDIISLGGFNMNSTIFQSCGLQGSYTGSIEAIECDLNVLVGLNGIFRRCGLSSNASLAAGGSVILNTCFSEIPGGSTPVLNCAGATELMIRNYSGGIELTNCQVGFTASVDLDPGTVKVQDGQGNTGGDVLIRGLGTKFIGTSIGTTIIDDLFDVKEAQIALASLVGNADVSGDDLTIDILDKNLNSLRQLSMSVDGRTRRIV